MAILFSTLLRAAFCCILRLRIWARFEPFCRKEKGQRMELLHAFIRKTKKRKEEKTILSNRDVLSRRSCFFLQVPCVSYPVALLDAISRSKRFSAPPLSQRVRTTSVGEQSCAC